MSIHPIGRLPDGTQISEIRLVNRAGAEASILNFGAALRDLTVPLADGSQRRVVLGFKDFDSYLENRRFLGVTVGRHASRIDHGRLPIDGVVHQLSLNDGPHHLHGGVTGFSRKPWSIIEAEESSVVLGLVSPDGDDGYPGRLEVRLTYRLLEPATFSVSMTATTDAPTFANLAHHSYFTLHPGHSIRDHRFVVNATGYTPLGSNMLPNGEIASVVGTPYDFRSGKTFSAAAGDPAFAYDCNFALDRKGADLAFAARLESPDNRLALEVHTTEPCLVLYDGVGLTPELPDNGAPHFPHAGLCLEPMRFPDNPNQPAFPKARLDVGETYRQETQYRFLT